MGFISDKARALLTYLVIEAQTAHRRESLVGLLWPDYPERKARHTLSQTLSNIRQVIGDRNPDQIEPFLLVDRQSLQFNRTSHYWLDVEHFGRNPTADTSLTRIQLEEISKLYRGDFMQGFSIGDSPAYEEWMLLYRERMQRIAYDTLSKLVTVCNQQDLLEKALYYAWQQLDMDAWREDAHRQVMRLLALTGNRTAALAQFDCCRRTLKENLGVDPEVQTLTLYESIKAGEIVHSTPNRSTSQTGQPSRPPHNLPAQLTSFVGRDSDLIKVRTYLDDPKCRLLTLVGPGGIGKTRLALEAVKPVITQYKQGIYFIALAPLQFVQTVVPTIVQILNLSFTDEGPPPLQQLIAFLKDKKLLLMLDNAEHLADISRNGKTESLTDIVTSILEHAPSVKILVTSRLRLNVLGEYLYPVRALPYPEPSAVQLEEIKHSDAIQLFVQSARSCRPDFILTEHNIHSVSAICQSVQGLPLAIVLAASWTSTFASAEIAMMLQDETPAQRINMDVLESEWRNLPPRHRSIRAVLHNSLNILAESEQQVFIALSVFRGEFTAPAAYAIASANARFLRKLTETAFITRTLAGRYNVHELVRQYAEEKLEQDPTAYDAIHNLHCTYYLDNLQRWSEDIKGPDQLDFLDKMDLEIDNIRTAWDWAATHQRFELIDSAAKGLWYYYTSRVRLDEAKTACEIAINALEKDEYITAITSGERLRILSKILVWYSYLLPQKQGIEIAERSLHLLDDAALATVDTRDEHAAVYRQMGNYLLSSNLEASRTWYIRSLAVYDDIQDRWEISHVLRDLGFHAWCCGEFKNASEYYNQSLSICLELGDLLGLALVKQRLGGLAMSMGQTQLGIQYAEESLQLSREIGNAIQIAAGLYSLAIRKISAAQHKQAVDLITECIALYENNGITYELPYAMLGWAQMLMGDYKLGQKNAQYALEINQAYENNQRNKGWVTFVLGSIALGQHNVDQAEAWLKQSIHIYRSIGQKMELSFAIVTLGYTQCHLRKLDLARENFIETLRIGMTMQSQPTLCNALAGIALWFFWQGAFERAVELYAVLDSMPYYANSPWYEDVVGKWVAQAASSLTPKLLKAARIRGKARDLDATIQELLNDLH